MINGSQECVMLVQVGSCHSLDLNAFFVLYSVLLQQRSTCTMGLPLSLLFLPPPFRSRDRPTLWIRCWECTEVCSGEEGEVQSHIPKCCVNVMAVLGRTQPYVWPYVVYVAPNCSTLELLWYYNCTIWMGLFGYLVFALIISQALMCTLTHRMRGSFPLNSSSFHYCFSWKWFLWEMAAQDKEWLRVTQQNWIWED